MKGHVYLMRSDTVGWHKIGRSANPAERLKQLNKQDPELGWTLVESVEVPDCVAEERRLHEKFDAARITKGKEWFRLSDRGVAECLRLLEELRDPGPVAFDLRALVGMGERAFRELEELIVAHTTMRPGEAPDFLGGTVFRPTPDLRRALRQSFGPRCLISLDGKS